MWVLFVSETVQNMPAVQETWVGKIHPLEKEVATHSCILAWRIPWTEEPVGLQSMGSNRVGHDLATKELGIKVLYIMFLY